MTREKASIIIGNIPINGDECYSIPQYQEAKTMAIDALKFDIDQYCKEHFVVMVDEDVWDKAEKALEQEPIDKSAMMCELYMEGVNMSGEYQGCWVRFKDIEKIVDKYIGDTE